jgi:hypothetical protein
MSRDKGNRGEREVARIIQEWWRTLEPTAEFIRTPLSGGWATNQKAASHFHANGDLMTTSSLFPFCVEVKWRESWSVNYFLDGRPTPPWGWWQQCVEAALKTGDVPMMWMRKNRIPGTRNGFPWLVLIPKSYVEEHKLSSPDVVWSESTLAANGVDYAGVLPVAYDFRRFIKMVPKRMKRSQAG